MSKNKGLYETLKEDLKKFEVDLEKDFSVASKILEYEHKHQQGLKTWRFVSIILLLILTGVIALFLTMLYFADTFTIFGRTWVVSSNNTEKNLVDNNKNVEDNLDKGNRLNNEINNENINKNTAEKTATGADKSENDKNVKVDLIVITDKNCGYSGCTAMEEMISDNIVKFMGGDFKIDILDINDKNAKKYISQINAKKLPIFIFSKDVEKLSKFEQVSPTLELKNNVYVLDLDMAQIPAKSFINPVSAPSDAALIGDKNAKVTVIEFSDLQCPFCAKFHNETFTKLKEEYIDKGKVKVLFVHLPLSFHDKAEFAANASECANEQGKFAEFIAKVYLNENGDGKSLTNENFMKYSDELGLDKNKFQECLKNNKYKEKIGNHVKFAQSLGVMGTPGFIVQGKDFIGGAYPFEEFKKIIDKYIK